MCGIAGALDLKAGEGPRSFDPLRLRRMAQSIRHRGPDGGHTFVEPGIALATRRLAIVDAARGRQPLCDPSGRVWVSCNGELFNAVSLRRGLAARGHELRTTCDTEIWPGLYLEEGEGVFAAAQGQFAVALWDQKERRLLLGRDRIGICPLYYTIADGWLLWASEIKALLASGLVRPEADPAGIDHVFSLFAAGTRRTCFRNIYSLWPGHFLSVRGGRLTQKRYFDIEFPEPGEEPPAPDIEPLIGELHEILRRAVTRRFMSDGPVATYLSGGLDSTLVLGLAQSLRSGPQLTSFTIGFDGAGPDERSRSVLTAERLGAHLEVLVPSPQQIVAALPQLIEAVEGPVMDTADACLLLLAERVRDRGFKAVLSGEGADEALGGYVWHKTAALMSRLGRLHPNLPRGLRALISRFVTPGTPEPRLGDFFGDLRPSLLDVYEPLSRARFLLYSDAMAEQALRLQPFADLDVDPERMRGWDPLSRSLYIEYKLMLPGHLLLGKGDRVGMHSGVENRYPFLDEEFIEFASRLPPSYKLRGRREKWILRELARRVLPPEIADPPKSMFKANPLCQLDPALQPAWVRQLTSPESLRRTGYFSVERVRREEVLQRLLPSFAPRRFVVDGSYTALVMTQLFHHLFLGGGLCELPVWSPPDPALPDPSFTTEQAHAL